MSRRELCDPAIADRRPLLAPGVRFRPDPRGAEPVLLFPEGILRLNTTAAAVLGLCDGRRSIATIVEELAVQFDAPIEALRADVLAYLGRLLDRRLVQLQQADVSTKVAGGAQ